MLGFLSHFLVRISKAVWYGFIWLCIRVFGPYGGKGSLLLRLEVPVYMMFFCWRFLPKPNCRFCLHRQSFGGQFMPYFMGLGVSFFCLKGFILDNCYLELLHLLKGLNNGQQRLIKTGNQILLKGRPKGKPEKKTV